VRERAAVVLAAGEGTRMETDLPKVLHRLGDRTLIDWVLDAAAGAGAGRTIVVVGHGGDRVRREAERPGVEFVRQRERKGTGHAVLQAASALARFDGSLLVLSGDVPLLRGATLRGLAESHEESGAAATVITALLDDPFGYGRVIRDGTGGIDRIVEEKDARAREREIREINAGTYVFEARELFAFLPTLRPENAGGELYLTDVVGALHAAGRPVFPYPVGDAWEVFGINTQEHLRRAAAHLDGRNHG